MKDEIIQSIISQAKGLKVKTLGQKEFEKMMDKGVPSSYLMDNWEKIKKALEKEGFTVRASRSRVAQMLIIENVLGVEPEAPKAEKGESLYAFSDNLEVFFNPMLCELEVLKGDKSWKGRVVNMGDNDIGGLKVSMKKYGTDLMLSFDDEGKKRQYTLQLRVK
jgi:hypothetical protein